MFNRLIAAFICVTFSFSNLQYCQAQDFSVNQLPVPGTMIEESAPFVPLALKGLVVNVHKPLEFQFIVDTGSTNVIHHQEQLKQQANQLVKYFLAGLTIPEGNLWVNLSPYEKNRIIPEVLGQTSLGRDLLAQDYILKQLTASLIYPEKDLGKAFWGRVYAQAQEQFGTTNIPVNTFNKVWILPNQAQVFESKNGAYVTKSTLKVMLDEDYLAMSKNIVGVGSKPTLKRAGLEPAPTDVNQLGSQIVRQIILPEITKEVNTGRNFARLRQIYQALILAKWYKETIQNSLLEALYTNKNKVAGVNLNDPAIKEQIYNRYLEAYKKGAFNYIKDDPTPDGQVVPRKYFSGGTYFGDYKVIDDGAMKAVVSYGEDFAMTVNLEKPIDLSTTDKALMSDGLKKNLIKVFCIVVACALFIWGDMNWKISHELGRHAYVIYPSPKNPYLQYYVNQFIKKRPALEGIPMELGQYLKIAILSAQQTHEIADFARRSKDPAKIKMALGVLEQQYSIDPPRFPSFKAFQQEMQQNLLKQKEEYLAAIEGLDEVNFDDLLREFFSHIDLTNDDIERLFGVAENWRSENKEIAFYSLVYFFVNHESESSKEVWIRLERIYKILNKPVASNRIPDSIVYPSSEKIKDAAMRVVLQKGEASEFLQLGSRNTARLFNVFNGHKQYLGAVVVRRDKRGGPRFLSIPSNNSDRFDYESLNNQIIMSAHGQWIIIPADSSNNGKVLNDGLYVHMYPQAFGRLDRLKRLISGDKSKFLFLFSYKGQGSVTLEELLPPAYSASSDSRVQAAMTRRKLFNVLGGMIEAAGSPSSAFAQQKPLELFSFYSTSRIEELIQYLSHARDEGYDLEKVGVEKVIFTAGLEKYSEVILGFAKLFLKDKNVAMNFALNNLHFNKSPYVDNDELGMKVLKTYIKIYSIARQGSIDDKVFYIYGEFFRLWGLPQAYLDTTAHALDVLYVWRLINGKMANWAPDLSFIDEVLSEVLTRGLPNVLTKTQFGNQQSEALKGNIIKHVDPSIFQGIADENFKIISNLLFPKKFNPSVEDIKKYNNPGAGYTGDLAMSVTKLKGIVSIKRVEFIEHGFNGDHIRVDFDAAMQGDGSGVSHPIAQMGADAAMFGIDMKTLMAMAEAARKDPDKLYHELIEKGYGKEYIKSCFNSLYLTYINPGEYDPKRDPQYGIKIFEPDSKLAAGLIRLFTLTGNDDLILAILENEKYKNDPFVLSAAENVIFKPQVEALGLTQDPEEIEQIRTAWYEWKKYMGRTPWDHDDSVFKMIMGRYVQRHRLQFLTEFFPLMDYNKREINQLLEPGYVPERDDFYVAMFLYGALYSTSSKEEENSEFINKVLGQMVVAPDDIKRIQQLCRAPGMGEDLIKNVPPKLVEAMKIFSDFVHILLTSNDSIFGQNERDIRNENPDVPFDHYLSERKEELRAVWARARAGNLFYSATIPPYYKDRFRETVRRRIEFLDKIDVNLVQEFKQKDINDIVAEHHLKPAFVIKFIKIWMFRQRLKGWPDSTPVYVSGKNGWVDAGIYTLKEIRALLARKPPETKSVESVYNGGNFVVIIINAMKLDKAPGSLFHALPKTNGGIDLNKIAVKRAGRMIKIQFDPAQLTALLQGGFQGFTPVITGMRRISSPFQLLGVNIAGPAEK